MTISIVLLICMTTCKHQFENLESYNGLVDECVIYDTGLRPDERTVIKKRLKCPVKFVDGYFDGHFGNLRNIALSFVSESDYIIFPDDSWALEGFSRDTIDLSTLQYICKLKNEVYTYDTCRIFHKSCRFTNTARNEQVVPHKKNNFINCRFIDTCRDTARTVRYNRNVRPEDFADLFQAGSWFHTQGLMNLAMNCYNKRLKQPDCIPEEKFLIYCFLALIHQDIRYYINAVKVYPDRAGEAYYYIYLVTGLDEYSKLAKKPLGHHSLMINLDIYEQIKRL